MIITALGNVSILCWAASGAAVRRPLAAGIGSCFVLNGITLIARAANAAKLTVGMLHTTNQLTVIRLTTTNAIDGDICVLLTSYDARALSTSRVLLQTMRTRPPQQLLRLLMQRIMLQHQQLQQHQLPPRRQQRIGIAPDGNPRHLAFGIVRNNLDSQ